MATSNEEHDAAMLSAPATRQATQDLFSAISGYSSHPDYRNAPREAAALEKMRDALRRGADWTALLGPGQRDAALTAATRADRAPLELLLAHGVPLNHRAGHDGMLIHRAAAFGCTDVVAMLIERGMAPDVSDPVTLQTPLACARAWKHGQRAVPMLIDRMLQSGCTPAPAQRGDDLREGPVRQAWSRLSEDLSPYARGVLDNALAAFFVERLGGRSKTLLAQLAEQNDEEVLGAGVSIVNQASTAKPRAKATKVGRGELIHHGDLEIAGDFDAQTLVVTGHLTVHGLLTHYEGRMVCVGGKLQANAVWSEGPLWVGGDLNATAAFGCCDNDHRAVIRGALQTPLMLHLDRHLIQAGTIRTPRCFERRQDVPEEFIAAFARALKIKPDDLG